ncbi:MAG: hypothetical protein RRY53_03175, partial [Pseudoflavonifractor sp.]
SSAWHTQRTIPGRESVSVPSKSNKMLRYISSLLLPDWGRESPFPPPGAGAFCPIARSALAPYPFSKGMGGRLLFHPFNRNKESVPFFGNFRKRAFFGIFLKKRRVNSSKFRAKMHFSN